MQDCAGDGTVELTYEARRVLSQRFGPLAAAVYDVLAHHAGERGEVEITTNLLASESGVSAKTVRRVIAELGDAGFITTTSQFKDNRQIANCYYLQSVEGALADFPGGQADQANIHITREEVTSSMTATKELSSATSMGPF